MIVPPNLSVCEASENKTKQWVVKAALERKWKNEKGIVCV